MIRPLHDYIVVRPLIRKQSDTLIIKSYEKQCRGEIVAVGPGKIIKNRRQPMASKVGQTIIFGDGTFDFYPKIRHEGQEYRFIQEADIVGVLEQPDVLMEAA